MRALSQRGYARHRRAQGLNGGTLKAVQKALADGRITAESDGRINPVPADEHWAGHTSPRVFSNSPARRGGRGRGGSSTPMPPVIVAYLVMLKRLNGLERAINACLAEAAEQPGAETSSAARWKAVYRELEALGRREVPRFQTTLYALAAG